MGRPTPFICESIELGALCRSEFLFSCSFWLFRALKVVVGEGGRSSDGGADRVK